MKSRIHVLVSLLTVLALGLGSGCTDDGNDDTNNGGRDVGNTLDVNRADVEEDTVQDVVQGFQCSSIETNNNAGVACQSPATCEDGTSCAILEQGETVGTCFQLCAPGLCEAMCTGDEVCIAIGDPQSGQPATFADGTAQGVCAVPPTGDVGAFGVCDSENLCAAGQSCSAFSQGATTGFCIPSCANGETCPTVGGIASQCILGATANETTGCGIGCQSDANCPTGLRCDAFGICLE